MLVFPFLAQKASGEKFNCNCAIWKVKKNVLLTQGAPELSCFSKDKEN